MTNDQPAEPPRKAPIVTRLKLAIESHTIAEAWHLERGNAVKAQEHGQHADTIRDAIALLSKREKAAKPGRIPTIEEVLLYASELGLPKAEAEKFFYYYESNGWKVGRNPMKLWQAALRNWKKRWEENGGKSTNGSRKPHTGDPEGWLNFLAQRGYQKQPHQGARQYLHDEFLVWKREQKRSAQ